MGSPFKLKNGSIALSVEVPGGLYNSAHLKKLSVLAETHSLIMKATEDQRILVFAAEDQVELLSQELMSGGMAVRNYQDGLHQPVSCLGALCVESKQDALKASLDITEALAEVAAAACLKIGINGCASCCVPCHTLDVSIIGTEDGYRISLGGRQNLVPEMGSFAAEGIPAAEIVDKVKAVVDAWGAVAEPGERFHEAIERAGMAPFIKALAPYSGDAAGALSEMDEEAGSGETEESVDELAQLQTEETKADEVVEAPAVEAEAPALDSEVPAVEAEAPAPDSEAPDTEVLDTGTPDTEAPDSEAPETMTSESATSETPVPETVADGEETPTVAEDNAPSEDEIESAVSASIDEESAVPELQDDNAAEREAVLDALPAEPVAMDTGASASDMIAEPIVTESVAIEATVSQPELVGSDEDSANADNVVAIGGSPAAPDNSPLGHPAADHSALDNVGASSGPVIQALAGMEVDANGKFLFTFEGGASISVDPSIIPFGGSRTIKFAGKELIIRADASGFNVEVDGLTFHMPLDVAA